MSDGMGKGSDNTPFFILGCVRSGTTMLRDILRIHPRLECPEETHYFRWSDPYGSPRYDRTYITMKLFDNHHKLDGISSEEFHEARRSAQSRRELSDCYGELYLRAVNNEDGRWFDKTPQNIYGIFLLDHEYPESRFIHIYRNPLNVVASLVEGRVMAKHTVKGAVNYWVEAMVLVNQYKKLAPQRLLEIPYENTVQQPQVEIKRICDFINEDIAAIDFSRINTHAEKNKYKKVLSEEEIVYVKQMTEPFYSQYGYA